MPAKCAALHHSVQLSTSQEASPTKISSTSKICYFFLKISLFTTSTYIKKSFPTTEIFGAQTRKFVLHIKKISLKQQTMNHLHHGNPREANKTTRRLKATQDLHASDSKATGLQASDSKATGLPATDLGAPAKKQKDLCKKHIQTA